jgi:hypothetical protein
MSFDNASKIKSLTATDATPGGRYARWKDEITMAEKETEKWLEKGRRVVRRFKDERDAADSTERKFNIFSTNVGILQSALYAKIPSVACSRRFGQPNDDAARVAALMLQNSIAQDMEDDNSYFDQVMREAVEDRLVPGLGAAWLRLSTEVEERTMEAQIDPFTGQTIAEAMTYEAVTFQEVVIEHVHWSDFLYSPCRTWAERRWVGRRVYMDQDAMVKRFGEEVGKAVPLDYSPKTAGTTESNAPKNEVLQKAIIYEIWDRQTKTVVWLSKAYPKLLDEQADPLKLEGFDPCPRPLFALTTTSNCIPVPDFAMIQDQYYELDDVNNRISMLVQACKVVGVYDQGSPGIKRMLGDGKENEMIPVDNWAMFAEKGGIKGVVDWFPLDIVIQALEKLRQAREDIKGQIYELTGISDIIRGDTKASETLGAQKIKAQFASVRIQKLQDEVARFAQDMLRIKGEIICRHFVPEQIILLSGIEFYPDGQNPQLVQAAMELLKGDEERFQWRVKVQADSLAMVDYAMQKQERVEFTNAVATFLQSAATVLQGNPMFAPVVFESLKFAVSGFKGSQEMEGVIDQTLEQWKQQMAAPKPPPPPDPAVVKAQAELQVMQQEAQIDAQTKQQELQLKAATQQQEMQMRSEEHQQKMQFMREEHQQKMQFDAQKAMEQIVQNARKDAESANAN